ncbi:MAG TPA: PH domain-containing protein [Tepidisphaeraceae bacterium]|jgi:hypothetical protein
MTQAPLPGNLAASARALTSPPHAAATDAAEANVQAPLLTILAAQEIEAGEIVQIIIKPSRWFILLNSLRFSAIAIMVIVGLHLLRWPLMNNTTVVQLMLLVVLSRTAFSAMQWMGRYYIVTDRRVMRLSGVFTPELLACSLRKVQAVKMYRTVGERLLGKGSIEITGDCHPHLMTWQTITNHREIHERVLAAVRRSQQNGSLG